MCLLVLLLRYICHLVLIWVEISMIYNLLMHRLIILFLDELKDVLFHLVITVNYFHSIGPELLQVDIIVELSLGKVRIEGRIIRFVPEQGTQSPMVSNIFVHEGAMVARGVTVFLDLGIPMSKETLVGSCRVLG